MICSTRSPGCRSTIRPAPRPRSCEPGRRKSRRPARPTHWSSWAPVPRRRPDSCWTRCATADRYAGSCRSTSTRACWRRPRPRSRASTLTSRSRLSVAISRNTWPRFPSGGRRLFVFLGSTIGNLTPGPRAEFLATLSAVMRPGDSLLLGTDLVKDTGRLVRAYDDAAGVTARFNRNVLAVINRELDADFDVDAYQHVARWNSDEERIEMWLRAERAPAGAGRRARADRRLRRRRRNAHRSVLQIPPGRRERRIGRRRTAPCSVVDGQCGRLRACR